MQGLVVQGNFVNIEDLWGTPDGNSTLYGDSLDNFIVGGGDGNDVSLIADTAGPTVTNLTVTSGVDEGGTVTVSGTVQVVPVRIMFPLLTHMSGSGGSRTLSMRMVLSTEVTFPS